MPANLRLRLSHDARARCLVALEHGRVGVDQPAGCWVFPGDTFALLLDAPRGRVVGFRVDELHDVDPADPEPAVLWSAPRFDVPMLGLTGVVAGEVAVAARRWFGDEDSLDRTLAAVALRHRGEEAVASWRACLEAGDGTAHFALGYTLMDLDRPLEAYAHLRHYTEIAPAGAWNWCWYGQAAEAIGEPVEAGRAYRRAIDLAAGRSAGAGIDAARRLAGIAGTASRGDPRGA